MLCLLSASSVLAAFDKSLQAAAVLQEFALLVVLLSW
jgi:hypothetical protein